MLKKFLCLLLCVEVHLQFSFGEDEVPLVQVEQGLIQGNKDKSLSGKDFYSYMSIPYAEPPVGDLRFKEPVPAKPWNNVLDGTKEIVPCLQTDIFERMIMRMTNSISINGREDCLHLNVFTHSPDEPEDKLPVMVFIHGGGFFFGGAQQYQPHVLMNRNIVLVVIQYRLGMFGFLSTEDSVLPGNMGLKDQQLALKWIKDNIDAFGGDPNRITIFGESAGGASVHYHILSPGSKGLFNSAIMQSGTAISPWASKKEHLKFAIEKGREFNCTIELGSENFLNCMQNVNPYYLTLAGLPRTMAEEVEVLPRVDGVFIDESPEILMRKGKYNKVNVISGVTRDEGALFLLIDSMNPKTSDSANFDHIGPILFDYGSEENPSDLLNRVFRFYFQREDNTLTENDAQTILEIITDRHFKLCHDTVSNIFAADKDVKFYSYQLDHFGQISISDVPGFNRTNLIAHMDDLAYLFSGGIFTGKNMENSDDLKLREIMLDLWESFAETGYPVSLKSSSIWRQATNKNMCYLSLQPSPVMKNDNFEKKRKFWSSLKTKQNMILGNFDYTDKDEF